MSVNVPELNVTFDCKFRDQGVIKLTLTLGGIQLDRTHDSSTLSLSLVLRGDKPEAKFANLDEEDKIVFTLGLRGEALSQAERSNWIGWSKIGEAVFDLDLTNEAGFRPMDWRGNVLVMKQLRNSCVVYGTNGVTLVFPSGNTFGFRELLRIGIKSKETVCGDDTVHFFIDRKGQIWKLNTENLERLGYEEFLSPLVNPVMLYDSFRRRVLISSSTSGFILSRDGMGGGYSNLTGYIFEDGLEIVTTPNTTSVSTPVGHPSPIMSTGILDFRQRGTKTITSVQVGTNVSFSTFGLELAYDFRFKQSAAFRSTRWIPINDDGVGFLRCAGTDFKIKIRSNVKDESVSDYDVAYLNIQVQFSDNRFRRGPGSTGRQPSRELVG